MSKRIVHISALKAENGRHYIYALAEDGTLWEGRWHSAAEIGKPSQIEFKWEQLPAPPLSLLKK